MIKLKSNVETYVRTYVRTDVQAKSGKPHVGRPLLGPAKIYGIGATIRMGQEIQCFPYTGFFLDQSI